MRSVVPELICQLYKVTVAARKALEKYKLEHPDEVDGKLEVDFPELTSPSADRNMARGPRATPPRLIPLHPLPQADPPWFAYPNLNIDYRPPRIQGPDPYQHYRYQLPPVLPAQAPEAHARRPHGRRR